MWSIMDAPRDPNIKRVRPHQLGWLRRPEFDTATTEVWEKPDGKLYAAERGKPLVFEVLKKPK